MGGKIVPILKTHDQGLMAVLESVLNGAEIPYFIRGHEAAGLLPLNATIVVPAEYEEQAKELLKQTQDAHEGDEAPGGD